MFILSDNNQADVSEVFNSNLNLTTLYYILIEPVQETELISINLLGIGYIIAFLFCK